MSQRTEKGSQFPIIRVIAKALIKGNTIPRSYASNIGNKIASNYLRYDGLHHWQEELQFRHYRTSNVVQGQICPAANAKFRCTPNVSESTI